MHHTGVRLERGAETTFKNGRDFFFLYTRPISKSVQKSQNQKVGRQIFGLSRLREGSDPLANDEWPMRPTPAELEVARALIARVKAADSSIKRIDELLWCAPQSHVDQESLAACRRLALGRWARTSRGRRR